MFLESLVLTHYSQEVSVSFGKDSICRSTEVLIRSTRLLLFLVLYIFIYQANKKKRKDMKWVGFEDQTTTTERGLVKRVRFKENVRPGTTMTVRDNLLYSGIPPWTSGSLGVSFVRCVRTFCSTAAQTALSVF